MFKLDPEKEVVFRRLVHQVRMATVGLEKLKEMNERFSFRQTVQGLYKRTWDFIKDYPELEAEFKEIAPSEPGRSNPDTFPAEMLILRGFLDGFEDTLNFQNRNQVATEFLIVPGQAFTANKLIGNILKSATKYIKIVDNYLSDDSVEMLENANSQVDFSILTKNQGSKYPSFLNAVKILKKGWKGKFEVRLTKKLHDRYLIVDDQEVWHCGPSLDYLGLKAGVISKLEQPEVISRIVDLFDQEWLVATPVVI